MSSLWTRVSLRTALPVLLATLLAAGLLLSGVATLTLLERTMVDELDEELAADAPRLVERYAGGFPTGPEVDSGGLPSDYVVVVSEPGGEVVGSLMQGTTRSTPDLPRLTVEEVLDLRGEPFTVDGDDGVRWRVLARAIGDGGGRVVGSVAVALPMTSVDATLHRMRGLLLGVGAAALAVVALGGWWGVRRALRPLTGMERTAAAIADGDLTRRVPEAPASTEVGRLGRALNEMLAQLEQAFAVRAASEERMRRFVADASHELRTPLAAVRGYAELHRMGALPDDEAVATTFRRVEESARRMGRLVEDLLQLARLDEGRPVRRERVDLAVLAEDALADLHALDPSRPVRLTWLPGTTARTTTGPGAPTATVLGDEDQLRQVLANLVGNVARHTPAGTAAEVRLGTVGGRVVLEVHDDGPGIAPQDAERVFERFYRADVSRSRESGGTGLGMAIVAAVVRAHDGEVAVVPGGPGTTVRVALPAAPTDRAPSSTGAGSSATGESSADDLGFAPP